jgi:hypothetical protein
MRQLTITVGLIADMRVINPFDCFIEDCAETFPFSYPKALPEDLKPSLRPVDEGEEDSGAGELVASWGAGLLPARRHPHHRPPGGPEPAVNADVGYSVRLEPGVRTVCCGSAPGVSRIGAAQMMSVTSRLVRFWTFGGGQEVEVVRPAARL